MMIGGHGTEHLTEHDRAAIVFSTRAFRGCTPSGSVKPFVVKPSRATHTEHLTYTSRVEVSMYVRGNIHAEKPIHLKIFEWTSMIHGYSIDICTLICVYFQ